MDWNTLLSVALGGLIAIIPVIISNRFQAREKDKDRQEQRRETRIQNTQKWMEKDILRIIDSIEQLVDRYSRTRNISHQGNHLNRGRNILSEEEYRERRKLLLDEALNFQVEGTYLFTTIALLVTSLADDELVSVSNEFANACREFMQEETESLQKRLSGNDADGAKADALWQTMNRSAGNFHRVLRNKLIELRED